jgi:hypothetical protein
MSEAVFGGYTEDQLREAFRLVKDKENWKLPVDAVVPGGANRDAISAAVAFYTGSSAEFVKTGKGRYRVLAAGYYACIGS